MDKTLKKILEIVTDTQESVSVLERDMAEIKVEIVSVRTELRDIRSRLDALEERVRGQSGYAKEIDMLIEEYKTLTASVSSFEKRLVAAERRSAVKR